MLRGNGIRRTAEKMVAWRWDLPARQKECDPAMGFTGLLK